MIDEHAGQPVADGLLDDGRGHRGVHPAGQAADGTALADLGPDLRHLLVDDAAHGPVGAAAGQFQEAAQHRLAVLGVHHLGVELHPVQAAGRVFQGRDRADGGPRGDGEPGRGRGGGVPVRHPDLLGLRQAVQQGPAEQRLVRQRLGVPRLVGEGAAGLGVLGGDHPAGLLGAAGGQDQPGGAVLAGAGVADLAAQGGHHELEAVADAEHRDTRAEQVRLAVPGGRERRRAVGVHRRGTAGQDDGLGLAGQDLLRGHRGWHDLGVHLAFTDPPRDQLRILGPEVDHQDGVKVRAGLHATAFRSGIASLMAWSRGGGQPARLSAGRRPPARHPRPGHSPLLRDHDLWCRWTSTISP